jgi:ADP-heptose:LPS heptosyltransferase
MSSLAESITLAYWKMKSFRQKAEDQFALPETLTDPRSLMVTMPFDSREFEMANEALAQLEKHYPRTKITVCLNETFRTWIPRPLIPRSLIVNPGDFTVFSWPKSSLSRKVQLLKTDIALDLNPDFHLGYAILCVQSGARVRITLDKPYSYYFFNFVIRSEETHKLRHRYDALVKYLIPHGSPINETTEMV